MNYLSFNVNALSFGIFIAAALFTVLILLFSLTFMRGKKRLFEYYIYILITFGATAGALFAADYITLLVFWGILAFTLYMLVGIGGASASAAAKKTFIIVGGADALMILGVAIIGMITRNMTIGIFKIPLNNPLSIIAFLCLAAGAFAKAGALPLHSWIPDSAEVAPATVMAYLPAALDKLLGIYLLIRLCMDVFLVEPNSAMSIFLLAIGSVTIITAVMAALIQHNLKKLLSFHAISQVGYMILGIGSGIPVAIAGGIFHMLNNAIYKSLLFLSAGAVENQTKTTELDRLGGLTQFMPITFWATLIAAFSISGIPPFNGFFSKWMIYQGLIDLSSISPLWGIWLAAAMFGSALTLASFMKIIHAVFLGQWSDLTSRAREVSWTMWVPMVVLASLCVIFGVFAVALPLKYFILPSVPGVVYSGLFSSSAAFVFIIIGLLVGLLLYWLGNVKAHVSKPAYVGGEIIKEETIKVSGIDFYNTIREWGPLDKVYKTSETKAFDVYEIGGRITFALSDLFKRIHNGLLHTYLAWMFLGFIILIYILIR